MQLPYKLFSWPLGGISHHLKSEMVRRYDMHEELISMLVEALFQLSNERPSLERMAYARTVDLIISKARGE